MDQYHLDKLRVCGETGQGDFPRLKGMYSRVCSRERGILDNGSSRAKAPLVMRGVTHENLKGL